jgi:uncharacterized protein (TIGR02594 family)
MGTPNVSYGIYQPRTPSFGKIEEKPEVLNAYFAIKKEEGKDEKTKKISFIPITKSNIGDEIYIVVETKKLYGKTIKLNIRQGKEKLLTEKDKPLSFLEGKDEKVLYTACVGELSDNKNYSNASDFTNFAITKAITLQNKKDETTKNWNKLIKSKSDKKTFLYILAEADTTEKVIYHGKNTDGTDDGEKRFRNIDGKWMELSPITIAPWMMYAKSYIGIYEDKTSKSDPTIQSWIDKHNSDFSLTGTDRPISSDNEPWCGIFVYNMLTKADVIVEKGKSWEYPAKASFFKDNWSNSYKVSKPQYGAIAKMNWSHVTFIYKFDDTHIWVLGGNQAEDGAAVRDGVTVNIVKYKKSQVQEYRMPNGY